MDTIKQCFKIILRGDKEDSRVAARKVKKLLYSSKWRSNYDDIKNQIDKAPYDYGKISKDWRQENFVVAISVIYFLHNKEEQPDFLFPWFFQLLQHSNGVIRLAAVRMISNEIGPLTVHIRFPNHKPGYFGKLKAEQSDAVLFSLFVNLNELLESLWEPKYEKYKYISSISSSAFKSAQMVLASIIDDCGDEYIEHLTQKYRQIFS